MSFFLIQLCYKIFQDGFNRDNFVERSDIFTHFQRWELILLFILATILVLVLISVGPFSPEEKRTKLSKRAIVKNPLIVVEWIRHNAIHYILFLFSVFANIGLTANWAVRNLFSNVSF